MKKFDWSKVLCGFLLFIGLSGVGFAKTATFPGGHIRNVTSYTEVFGEGQKLTAVIVEYDQSISNKKLSAAAFTVTKRTVTNVYATTKPERTTAPKDGKYVVIELSLADAGASTTLWGIEENKMMQKILDPTVAVKQVGAVTAVSGAVYRPVASQFKNNTVVNAIVDNFQQFEYKDPKTGISVRYNLYIPKSYDAKKSYPLVLFMHDRGALSSLTKWTLVQGLGAVSWASPADQAKHEAFVLAPQYAVQVVDDDYNVTADLDATVNLLGQLTKQYSIDTSRLYTTGQSMGCMMSIVMNVRYPDLFAASFLVSGQWDPKVVSSMATKKIWIAVSEGDDHAFPGMNEITSILGSSGGTVAKATWDATATPDIVAKNTAELIQEKANINYVSFKKGTVTAKEDPLPDNDHRGTWQVVYSYEGVRDWIFAQKK